MVGKSLENLKVTHEEVINTMAMQMAAINMELTVVKLENQKLKEFLSDITLTPHLLMTRVWIRNKKNYIFLP